MGEVIAFPEWRLRPVPVAPSESSPDSPDSPALQSFTVRETLEAGAPAGRPTSTQRRRTTREPLWREVAGSVLREERRRQDRTLAQVAARAGMSVQYLSELERGRKEASSEMLAAACGSLGLGLAEFAQRCALTVSQVAARPTGPVLLAA